MKQRSLFADTDSKTRARTMRARKAHGGDLSKKGHRKEARPFDPRKAIHVVLRSKKARGEWSMLRPRYKNVIQHTVYACARKAGVKIYRFANVGNHLHILIKTESNRFVIGKRALQAFLRLVTGGVAMKVTGACKSNALKARFWDGLAFTRLVEWGRAYDWVKDYFFQNLLQADGLPKVFAEGLKQAHAEVRAIWDDWLAAGVAARCV